MDLILEYTPLLLSGAKVTVSLAVLSLLLATTLGAMGAAARIGGGFISRSVVFGYTSIVRGIPDLVLILLIYFGGQRLINQIGASFDWDYIELPKFWAGVLAIGFIYGAYLTETFRGAYQSVPRGQYEACQALGLPKWITLSRVIGPQVLRFALPGYGNVWQVLVKSTAVVSVIGLDDLVGLADKAGKSAREPFLFFTIVLLIYLIITAVSGWGLTKLERRVNIGHGGKS